ncbi:SDR family NAD(P)-dependent oxidoreductase [Nocardia sp. NPDC052278]|uniref:SDR family NAD(P)-dependent oxidoreductase n=1 Tax=unclassified Nocardia TaxID=2637762 RepID=UPI0036CFD4D8
MSREIDEHNERGQLSASLQGRVALVTGGGAGIGEGIVRRFSEEGAQVVLADRGSGEATANRVGGLHLPTDVTERAQVEAAVAATVDTYGRIDILVNNASSGMTVSRVESKSDEQAEFAPGPASGTAHECQRYVGWQTDSR